MCTWIHTHCDYFISSLLSFSSREPASSACVSAARLPSAQRPAAYRYISSSHRALHISGLDSVIYSNSDMMDKVWNNVHASLSLSLPPSPLTGAEEGVAGGRREGRQKRSPPYWGLWSSDFYGWLEELRARADHEGMRDLARTFWAHFPVSNGLGYDSPESDPQPEEWGQREAGGRFKSVRVGGRVLQHVFTCSQHGAVDVLTLTVCMTPYRCVVSLSPFVSPFEKYWCDNSFLWECTFWWR